MRSVKAASLALMLSYAQAGRSNTRVIQLEREGVSDRRSGSLRDADRMTAAEQGK